MGMSENNLLALLNNIYRFDSSLIEFFSLSFFSFFLEIVNKQTMHFISFVNRDNRLIEIEIRLYDRIINHKLLSDIIEYSN